MLGIVVLRLGMSYTTERYAGPTAETILYTAVPAQFRHSDRLPSVSLLYCNI